eukprot:GILK01009478.1.p1 GENE.GILK01009478.1~~GILK01009478.1.p1  ORF type:complete len:239 (-),score=39.44 GILK01009478.1:307-1023(-)
MTRSTQRDFSTSGISNSGLNVEDMIVAVSRLIHDQIRDDDETKTRILTDKHFSIFNEENYFAGKEYKLPRLFLSMLKRQATANDVYLFIKGFYVTAKFSPVCVLISLIYINRFVVTSKLPLHRLTWRPIVITSILIAQKMWDDINLQTSDFAEIYPFFTVKELIRIEAKFLAFIDFHLYIKMSLYAEYYFSVQSIVKSGGNLNKAELESIANSSNPITKMTSTASTNATPSAPMAIVA